MPIRSAMAALVVAWAGCALAHDPSSPFAAWFMSLHQPDNPVASCCGEADQFYVDEYREKPDGGFAARVNGEWIDVPAEKVNWNDVNPTGRGVIFLSQMEPDSGYVVLCFVPAVGM